MSENQRIKIVRKNLGLTLEEFGKTVGVTKGAMSAIETGKRGVTNQMRISICQNFHVNEAWLRTGDGDPFVKDEEGKISLDELAKKYNATDLELQLMQAYFELDEFTRRRCMNMLKDTFQVHPAPAQPRDNVIPIQKSHLPVSAGTGVYLGPEEMETIYVVENELTRRASFCVPVSGDSMEPVYHDGDILLVEGKEDIGLGEIGIFTVDGDGYVKKRGDGELLSLNPAYPPVPMVEDATWCNGLVIGTLDPTWLVE